MAVIYDGQVFSDKEAINYINQWAEKDPEGFKNWLAQQDDTIKNQLVGAWNRVNPNNPVTLESLNQWLGVKPQQLKVTGYDLVNQLKDLQTTNVSISSSPISMPQTNLNLNAPFLTPQNAPSLFQVPKIEAPKIDIGVDYQKMQEDMYQGLRSKIMSEAEESRKSLQAAMSKMGTFRSGLHLEALEKLDLNTQRALAEAWTKATIETAKLQADIAKKQGDWEMAAQLENASNYLKQLQIINDYQTKILQLEVQKYAADKAAWAEVTAAAKRASATMYSAQMQYKAAKARDLVDLYGIMVDKETKYDLASLDYLKSMNLANMDALTRITTSYGQWTSDWVKQALANKNYKEAAKIKDDVLMPLYNALLPPVVSWLGKNNPDTQDLQEGYQKLYGITVSEEDINKLIDKVNNMETQLKSLQQNTGTYPEYDYLGG